MSKTDTELAREWSERLGRAADRAYIPVSTCRELRGEEARELADLLTRLAAQPDLADDEARLRATARATMFALLGDTGDIEEETVMRGLREAIAPYAARIERDAKLLERCEKALESCVSALDRAMGDTDPYDAEDPLLVACQGASTALAAIRDGRRG